MAVEAAEFDGRGRVMTDVVVTLKAAAETLQRMADRRALYALNRPDDASHAQELRDRADEYRALATLIDGMLEQHERWFNEDYPQIAATCEPCGDYWPCPSLRLVADLVNTVLGSTA